MEWRTKTHAKFEELDKRHAARWSGEPRLLSMQQWKALFFEKVEDLLPRHVSLKNCAALGIFSLQRWGHSLSERPLHENI